jgi:hypothetical protein
MGIVDGSEVLQDEQFVSTVSRCICTSPTDPAAERNAISSPRHLPSIQDGAAMSQCLRAYSDEDMEEHIYSYINFIVRAARGFG